MLVLKYSVEHAACLFTCMIVLMLEQAVSKFYCLASSIHVIQPHLVLVLLVFLDELPLLLVELRVDLVFFSSSSSSSSSSFFGSTFLGGDDFFCGSFLLGALLTLDDELLVLEEWELLLSRFTLVLLDS